MPEPDIPEVSAGQTIASTWGNTVRTKVQDLTDGHKHDGVGSKKVDHANLDNVTSDQHHNRSHDHSLVADGTPIAIAGVPDLPATKITSLRLALARLPDATLNYLLLGQGAGADPVYGAFTDTIHGSRGSGLHADSHSRLHDHSLAADGSPIALAGVPDLPASKITSETFNLDRIPTPLTGKDADTLDTKHYSDIGTEIDGDITTHTNIADAHHAKVHGLTEHNSGSARISVGLDANKPAAGTADRLYYATDTGIVYRDTGATWVEIARGETFTRLAQLSEKSHASLTNVTSDQHHAQLHKGSHESGGGDALTALSAGIITSGILAAARGGLGKILDDAAIGDDKIVVYKTTGDKFVYESKPAGGGDMYKSTYDTDDDGIVDNSEKLEGSTKTEVQAHSHTVLTGVTTDQHHAQLHKDAHKTGGGDAFALADLLDCVARLKVRKNTGASDIGARRRLNLIEGSNVTLTVADDPTDEEIDITIASAGGGAAAVFGGLLSPFDSDGNGGDTGYTVGKVSWSVRLATGATSAYSAWIRWRGSAYTGLYDFFNKNPQIEFYIKCITETLQDIYIWVGELYNAPTGTAKKFGIHIAGGASASVLRIMSADGTTWSETGDLMTLAAYTWYRIKVKLTTGTNIEVWVDGVSKGTKTTNLPSGTMGGDSVLSYRITTGESVGKQVDVSSCKLEHD